MEKNDDAEGSARKYSNDTANERKEPEVLDLRYPKDATKESEDPMDLCVRTKKPEDLDRFNEVETNLKKPTCSKENPLPSTAESCAVASPSSSKQPRMRQETIHQCPEQGCSYSTVRAYYLKIHNRTHTKEKPFSCPHCTKEYTRKRNLLIHYERHHEDKLPIPEELQVRPNSRPRVVHACSKCGKRFRRKGQLERHEHMHHLAVPHTCPVCFRNFPRESDFLKHFQFH